MRRRDTSYALFTLSATPGLSTTVRALLPGYRLWAGAAWRGEGEAAPLAPGNRSGLTGSGTGPGRRAGIKVGIRSGNSSLPAAPRNQTCHTEDDQHRGEQLGLAHTQAEELHLAVDPNLLDQDALDTGEGQVEAEHPAAGTG